MPETTETQRVGRPRSEESKAAILEATWQLLQSIPLKRLSIEAISREAGVGKTTIYRWWPSKTAVAVDAFLAQIEAVLPFPETKTVAESLVLQVQQVVKAFQGDVGRIVAGIVAEGQDDPEALTSFCDRFLNPRREVARQVIQKGIDSGELDSALDPDVAMDILYGPIYYRLLLQHLPLDEEFGIAISQRAVGCLFDSIPGLKSRGFHN